MSKLTKAQIEASKAKATAAAAAPPTTNHSGVVNPDPELEYRILDLAQPEGRLIAQRDRLDREGWIRLDPSPAVAGISRSEVWAMPRDVYETTLWAAQVERDQQNRMKTKGKPVRML
ncbi:MAG: hypothetical protein H6747_09620 [Deltaproteobacteria bacterium]|nr:hypothetical protein [Deltaproteobacteria bacterium]